jgi:hypothetical protein
MTSSAREQAIPQFLAWLERQGVQHQRVGLGASALGGLAIIAREDIAPGDVVIRVPLSAVINDLTVRRRHWPDLATFDGPAIGADRWALVYLFLAVERSLGPRSPHAPLLAVLPSVVRTPVSYTNDELALLRGTNLHEAVLGIRSKLHALADHLPALASPISYDDLVWAYEVFWSRCFAVLIDSEEVASLVPLCGMLNHSPESRVTYITDAQESTFAIRSEMCVRAGSEFFNNYRHRSNEKLLLNYGFVCDENSLDAFTLRVRVIEEEPLVAEKKALLAARKIPWEHYLTANGTDDPIPASLYECIRILCMDEAELYFFDAAEHPAGS